MRARPGLADRHGGVRPQQLAFRRAGSTTRRPACEQYGYDASWTAVRAIVDDAGEARMRDVFGAAEAPRD